VIEECKGHGIDPPTFEEHAGALYVTFRAAIGPGQAEGPSRDQVGTKSGLSEQQLQVLEVAEDTQPLQELMRLCGRSNRTKFRDQVLRPLLDAGLLEMTVPDKPTSSLQRYRATAAGKRVLEE